MTRHAQLVGRWPARAPGHAMITGSDKLAPCLTCLTDGEAGDRQLWITPATESSCANPDVELVIAPVRSEGAEPPAIYAAGAPRGGRGEGH